MSENNQVSPTENRFKALLDKRKLNADVEDVEIEPEPVVPTENRFKALLDKRNNADFIPTTVPSQEPVDPKKAQQARKVSQETGKPIQEVMDKPEEAQQQFREAESNKTPVTKAYLDENPPIRETIKSPESLGSFERFTRGFSLKKQQGQIISFTGYRFALKDFLNRKMSETDKVSLQKNKDDLARLQLDYKALRQGFFSKVSHETLNQFFIMSNVAGSALATGAAAAAVGGAIGGLVGKGKGAATGAGIGWKLGKGTGMVGSIAMLEGAWLYQDIKGQKDYDGQPIDEATARGISAFGGAINGGLELVGWRAAFKALGPADKLLMNKLLKGPVGKKLINSGIGRTLGLLVEAGATGALEETLQEIVSIVAEEVAKSGLKPSAQGAMPAMVQMTMKPEPKDKMTLDKMSKLVDNVFTKENMRRVLASAEAGLAGGIGIAATLKTGKTVSKATGVTGLVEKVKDKVTGKAKKKKEREAKQAMEEMEKEQQEKALNQQAVGFASELHVLGEASKQDLKELNPQEKASFLKRFVQKDKTYYMTVEDYNQIENKPEDLDEQVEVGETHVSIPQTVYYAYVMPDAKANAEFVEKIRENPNAKSLSEATKTMERAETKPKEKDKDKPTETEEEFEQRLEQDRQVEEKSRQSILKDDEDIKAKRREMKEEFYNSTFKQKLIPAIENNKMDLAEGKRYFDGEIPDKLKPYFVKDGTPVLEVVAMSDYATRKDLMEALENNLTTAQEIDAEVEGNLEHYVETEKQDLIDDHKANHPIVQRRLREENEKLVGPTKAQEIREDIAEVMSNTTHSQIEPSLYKRAAQDVTDPVQKARLNEMYLQSGKLKVKLNKKINRFKRMRTKGKEGVSGQFALSILNQVGIRNDGMTPQTDEQVNDSLEVLGNVYRLFFPDFVADSDFQNYTTMTAKDLNQFTDLVGRLIHIEANQSHLLTDKSLSLEKAVDTIVKTVKEHSVRKTDKQTEEKPNIYNETTGQWSASLMRPTFMMKILQGNQLQGPITKIIGNKLATANDQEIDMNKDFISKLDKIGLTKHSRNWAKTPVFMYVMTDNKTGAVTARAESQKLSKKEVKGFKVKVFPSTKADLFAVSMLMGSQTGMQRVMKRYGTNQKEMSKILGETLSESDLNIANKLHDLFDTYLPMVKDLEKEVNGEDVEKVQAVPYTITLKNGKKVTMKGGYYPLRYLNIEHTMDVEDIMNPKKMFYNEMTKQGHTIERESNVNYIVDTNIDVISRVMADVIHDLTHRKAVIDAYKIFQTPKVKEAITNARGKHEYEAIIDWVKNVANPAATPTRSWVRAVSKLVNVTSMAMLGYNPKVALLQSTGLFVSMDEIGAKYIAKGFKSRLNSESWRKHHFITARRIKTSPSSYSTAPKVVLTTTYG